MVEPQGSILQGSENPEQDFLKDLCRLSDELAISRQEISHIFLSSLIPFQLSVDIAESGGRPTAAVFEELKSYDLLKHIMADIRAVEPKEAVSPSQIEDLVSLIGKIAGQQKVGSDRMINIFTTAIDSRVFIEKISLKSGKAPKEVSFKLKDYASLMLVGTGYRIENLDKEATGEEITLKPEDLIDMDSLSYASGLMKIEVTFPGDGIKVDKGKWLAVKDHFEAIAFSTAKRNYNYRGSVMKYFDEGFREEMKFYDEYVTREFTTNGKKLQYIISSGIGANEMFSRLLASLHESFGKQGVFWIVIDSPVDIKYLPKEANDDNTLILEFSRSGETQETLKIMELTCHRFTKRIAYANKGPLREFALRLKNQGLTSVEARDIESRIGGRLMRRLTQMTYGPMYLAGMDAERYARFTDKCDRELDFSRKEKSLAASLARFLFACTVLEKRHDLSCLYNQREMLRHSFYELRQLIMEGANKKAGLPLVLNLNEFPRDAHVSIEGVFGQARQQVAIGIIARRSGRAEDETVLKEEDTLDAKHKGLTINDIDYCFAHPNIAKCQKLMPTISIEIDMVNLEIAAALSSLWEDMVVHYCALTYQDPNSNFEVKSVREGTGKLLVDLAEEKRKA